MTASEKIADIQAHPEKHKHDFDDLTACCMVNGCLDTSVMDAHQAYVDMGSNGGVKCDVTSGPCACGAWHDAGDKIIQVYDVETKKVRSMPAKEMTPGMIRAQIPGIGIAWVDTSQARAAWRMTLDEHA